MKLHEIKTQYDIISHGNQFVSDVEPFQILICPECFSTEIVQSDISNHKDRYCCNDCGCEFTVENVTVTTRLFDILSCVFSIGAIILFVSFIIFACAFVLTKNKIFSSISIVSCIVAFIFAAIFSCIFDASDY